MTAFHLGSSSNTQEGKIMRTGNAGPSAVSFISDIIHKKTWV